MNMVTKNCWLFTLFVTVSLWFSVIQSNNFANIGNWTQVANNVTLPFVNSRLFVVYSQSRDAIYGLGGSKAKNEWLTQGWKYFASENLMEYFNFTFEGNGNETMSETFWSGDSNAARLIDDRFIYALGASGRLWKYDIDTYSLTVASDEMVGILSHACLVYDNDNDNDYLYSCNGDATQPVPAACYQYSLLDGTWIQLPSVPQTQTRPSCAIKNDEMFVFMGSNPNLYKLDLSDLDGNWTLVAQNSHFNATKGPAIVVNDNIYQIGGKSSSVYSIDANTYSVTEYGSFPLSIMHHQGVFVPNLNRFYTFGGLTSAGNIDSIYYASWSYDGPSTYPTNMPSINPTQYPTQLPSHYPSDHPSSNPNNNPSGYPTELPSKETFEPSMIPSYVPSNMPSSEPSPTPTMFIFSSYVTGTAPASTMSSSTMATTTTTVKNVKNENETKNGNDFLSQMLVIVAILLGLVLIVGCILIVVVIKIGKRQKQRISQNAALKPIESNTNDNNGKNEKYDMQGQYGTNGDSDIKISNIMVNDNDDDNKNDELFNIITMMENVLKSERPQLHAAAVTTNGLLSDHGHARHEEGEVMSEIDSIDNINAYNTTCAHEDAYKHEKNWTKWNSNDINQWLQLKLRESNFNDETIDQFIKQFILIDMTGIILKTWIDKTNADKQKLLQLLQSKIQFNPNSLVWDAAIEAMINLAS